MYLSRIALTPAIAEGSQLNLILKDNQYGMHRLFWDLFDQERRFLFREENQKEQMGSRRNLPVYYVLSSSEPEQNSVIFSVETKPFEPQLNAGDQLAFRLRANPVVSRKTEGRKHSVRHDVVMDAQYQWLKSECARRNIADAVSKGDMKTALRTHEDFTGKASALETALNTVSEQAALTWMIGRGEKIGAEIHPEKLQATAYRWNALPEKGRRAGFSSMDFEGVLTVTDPDVFRKKLAEGIGPSKAFGCGLMMIRRI